MRGPYQVIFELINFAKAAGGKRKLEKSQIVTPRILWSQVCQAQLSVQMALVMKRR